MEGDGAVDDAAAESKGTVEVDMNIRCSDGSKFSVQISLESTVESFRGAIAQKRDISPDQRLIYKGRVLRNDHQTLKSYGLKDGDTVDLAATTNTTGGTKGSTNSTRSPSLTKDPMNATVMAGAGTQGGQASNPSTNFSSTSSEALARSSSPNTSPLPNPWTSTRAGGTQNNTTGSTRGGNAQAPTALGLDPTFIPQLVQNPNFYLIRHSILANPRVAIQILQADFEKRGMPKISSFLVLMALTPEALQLALLFQLVQQRSTQESNRAIGVQDPMVPSNMSRELGTGSPAVPNSNSDEPPEQLYATQLSQLQEMGFSDTQENIRALTATSGDVHEAVKRLSGNSAQ